MLRRSLITFYFALAAAQALAAVAWLIRIPSDPKNAVLLGLSLERLALLAGPVVVAIGAASVLVAIRRASPRYSDTESRFLQFLRRTRRWAWIVLAAAGTALLGFVFLLITRRETPFVLAPRGALPDLEIDAYFVDLAYFAVELYLPRLLPLVVLAIGLAVQTIVLLPLILFGREAVVAKLKRQSVPAVLALFGLFFIGIHLGVAALKGQGADTIGWNTIGGPILETQAAAAFALAIALLAAGVWMARRVSGRAAEFLGRHGDKAVFLLLWIAAAVHWNALPLQPSWYLAAPQPPYAALTPNSDALVYDLTAQNMLAGEGLRSRAFDDVIVRRPLYTFTLGVLNTLAGGDYRAVSALQAALLAVFPAFVYLVGRDLHSRPAGLAAAALVVWREGNTIALADQITVAHARLFMSDLPTALGVAVFTWLAVRALRAPARAGVPWLAAGAMLGGLILVRPETALLYPTAAIFLWICLRGRFRPTLPGAARLAAGTILLLTPWLVRNFAGTGELFLEVPGNRLDFLIQRFRTEDRAPAARADLRELEQAEGGGAGVVGAHFLHSNLQSVLIFPTAIRIVDAGFGYTQHDVSDRFWETCCYRTNYIRRLPFWNWQKWDLGLPPETRWPAAITLLTLSIGLAGIYRRSGPAALMPAAFGQAYFLVNALARTSGGRYLVPVDWIWIVFYAAGLAQVAWWTVRLVGGRRIPIALTRPPAVPDSLSRPERSAPAATPVSPAQQEETRAPGTPPPPARRQRPWLAPAAVLLLGTLLPLGERMFPTLYPPEPPAEWVDAALAASGRPAGLEAFLADPDTVALHGRTLYPRYYAPGDGEAGETYRNLFADDSYRVTFFVAGPTSSGVRLVVAELPAYAAEHGEDVLVFGCRVNSNKDPYVEAVAVYFPGSGVLLERDRSLQDLSCSRP